MKNISEYSYLSFVLSYFYAYNLFNNDPKIVTTVDVINKLAIQFELEHIDSFIDTSDESYILANSITENNFKKTHNFIICTNKGYDYYKPYIIDTLVEWFKTI